MTVLLPRNFDPARKHPLLVYLNGGDGGNGDTLGVARGISSQQDFVCVSMPLFKADKPWTPGFGYIMIEPDGKYMWPFFKTMLDKVEALVPNIDPAHRVLGGFSNGAHATAALIDGSDGEVSRLFSAFLFVEGGGKLKHYDWLKGKTVMMVSSNIKSKPRAQQILDAAVADGAKGTFLCEDVGKHDFPVAAYKKVDAWLHGPAQGGFKEQP
jgi:predicted peptidase